VNRNSGKVLVEGQLRRGSNVLQWTEKGVTKQQWQLVPAN